MAAIKRSRIINTSRVMREIWINRQTSRVRIAKTLHLDKSTISNIVSNLLDIGVIVEMNEGDSGPQGGRKPVFLTLNKKYGCVLGIEMRPESYTAVVVGLEGEILYSKFELIQLSGENLIDTFLEITDRLIGEFVRTGIPILGIGVGLAGVVNPKEGIIRYSIPLLITEPFDFYEAVASKFLFPIFIENDANSCAWAELAFHREKDLKDFIFVLAEFNDINRSDKLHEKTGVGFGIVMNGKVHYGHTFSAGEFRSVICTRENKGQFSLTDDEVFTIEENPKVLLKFINELSLHIALFVNTFNMSHVFLGGDIENYTEQVEPLLQKTIQENWSYPDKVKCKIIFSSLKDKAVAYGAAGMVLDKLFADLEIMEGVGKIRSGGIDFLPGWKHSG